MVRCLEIIVACVVSLLCLSGTIFAKERPIVLKGRIHGYADSTLTFSYQAYQLLSKLKHEEVKVDAKGNFKVRISEASPLRGFFSIGKKPTLEEVHITRADGMDTTMTMSTVDPRLVFVYLAPGDRLGVSVDTADYQQTLRFTGRHSDDSYLVNAMEREFNSYTHRHLRNYYSIVNYGPSALHAYASGLEADKLAFLDRYANEHRVRPHLVDVLRLEAHYTAVSTRINYPVMRKQYVEDDTLRLPPDYYRFLDSVALPVGLKDKGIGYYYFLDNYLHTKHRLQAADTEFYHWCELELGGRELYAYLAFALGRDFKRALYDRFGETCPYPGLARLVHQRYAGMTGMLEGSPAPALVLQDTTGGTVALAAFKGKYVYIDCWATWCGPCIKEIPSLQELESAFADRNIVFLSLSFDSEGDHDKWKQFIVDYPLHGHQYWLDAEQKERLSGAFNIQQIPRFILLDPDGRVVDANAPRPSQPETRALLQKLVGSRDDNASF